MTTAAPPSPFAKSMPAAPPPLLLTIRFSAALPDLELDIPRPGATTVVSLKHLIRSRLDKANARRRLRFIHGGKILPDTAVLSSVLRAPPPPPPSSSSAYPYDGRPSGNSKASLSGAGKQAATADGRNASGRGAAGPESNESATSKSKGKFIPGRPEPSPRIYVNCSIGDELTPAELHAEAQAAALPPPTSHHAPPSQHPASASLDTGLGAATGPSPTTTTTPTPRGFDRLLSAGFTASEVNQLRLQFRSIHASRYTPDTLPSPDSFRRMEDAWIDDNGAVAMPASTGGSDADNNGDAAGGGGGMLGLGGGGTDSDEVGLVATIDVLIRGVITGFIWPLGSAGWLIREEGMSSDRWRFMVGVGVLFSVLIGFIRAISGDK
ncbi:DUF2407 C-terminal domain-containing protein [Xylariaceae sp. FL1651]|nr:DUF2407 C-terminal domain-containing protein [Xylariaceae sp. FL1651]